MKRFYPLALLLLLLLIGCSPITAVPSTQTAAGTVAPTTTITPGPTNTTTTFFVPSSTPGPTPTAISVQMGAGECMAPLIDKLARIEMRRIGPTLCLLWEDGYSNELGYRLVLRFGYNGEIYVYETPPNRSGMPLPPPLTAPLDQSFEFCLAYHDYTLDIYALLPDREPAIVTGMAANMECNIFLMPSATPPATTAIDRATEVYTGLTGAPSPFSASRIIVDRIIWIGPDATGTVQVYTGYFIENQELGVFVSPRHDLQNYTFYPLPEKVGGWELEKKSGLEIVRYDGSVLSISTPNGEEFTFDVINRQYLRKVDDKWTPYPTPSPSR